MPSWREIKRADQRLVLVQLGRLAIEAARLYPGPGGLHALVDAFVAAIEELERGAQ